MIEVVLQQTAPFRESGPLSAVHVARHKWPGIRPLSVRVGALILIFLRLLLLLLATLLLQRTHQHATVQGCTVRTCTGWGGVNPPTRNGSGMHCQNTHRLGGGRTGAERTARRTETRIRRGRDTNTHQIRDKTPQHAPVGKKTHKHASGQGRDSRTRTGPPFGPLVSSHSGSP